MLCLVSAIDSLDSLDSLDDWGLSDKFKSNLEWGLASELTILNCGLSFLPVFNTSRNDLAEA